MTNQISNVSKENKSVISVSLNGDELQVMFNDAFTDETNISVSAIDIKGRVVTTVENVDIRSVYLNRFLFAPGVYTIITRSGSSIFASEKFIYK